jgi:hypothetical protein
VRACRARGDLEQPLVLHLREHPGRHAEVVEGVGVARVAALGLAEAGVGRVEVAHRRLGAREEDAGRNVARHGLEPLRRERLRPTVVAAMEGAGVFGKRRPLGRWSGGLGEEHGQDQEEGHRLDGDSETPQTDEAQLRRSRLAINPSGPQEQTKLSFQEAESETRGARRCRLGQGGRRGS